MTTVTCTWHQAVTWLEGAACPYRDGVAVFRFPLMDGSRFSSYLRSLLQPDEQTRADRYYRNEDRHRFICTRSILRILTGRYTNQRPESIRFLTGTNTKPELSGNTGWHINVSHSGNWILIAVGRVSVGVDVEQLNADFPFRDVLLPSFSEDEQRQIDASANPRLLFYQLWTRKEALLKATAQGINDDLPRIPSLDGTYEVDDSLLGEVGNWLVAGFMLTDTYPASLAYRATAEIPKFYTLDSGLFAHYES